jgi:hypothetical protein
VRVSSCCALRASGQQPASAPPFSARCRAMRFHVRGVDHLCVCGSSVSSKLPEQVFPDATPRPAHKAIIDRCRRSILGRAIAPATAAFQNMHDAADDAAVVRPLDAPYIRRQMRFDPSPLLVAQPKQVPAHNPDPLPTTNQDRIVRAKKLMSSDPSRAIGVRPITIARTTRGKYQTIAVPECRAYLGTNLGRPIGQME